MLSTDPVLTAEEARVVRDNEPTFSDRQGIDLPAKLNGLKEELAAEFNNIVTGTATVLNTTTSITVTEATLGAAFGGSPVQLTFAESPTAATLAFATWSGDDLVVNIDQNNTADIDLFYSVDGR